MLINKKQEKWLLFLIFLIVLGTKLYFAFQTPHLNNQAYFEQRQIESIFQTGFPLSWDSLSYSGRSLITSPIYYYVMAFFSSFLGIGLTLKVLPNIFISLLTIVVFLIVKKITQNSIAAFFSAGFVGFIPALSSITLLTASPYSLVFLLMFLSLYFFINIRDKKYFSYFIIIVLILPFVHPATIIVLLGLFFYLVLMKLDGFIINKTELETVIFATFFMTLVLFLQYKQALIINGAGIVWQNIPQQILKQYFSGVNILSYVAAIGIIPLLFGVYTIYKYTFQINKSSIHVFIGLCIATFFLLWLKLIQPTIGLALIGICLIILTGEGIKLSIERLKHTKFLTSQFLFLSVVVIIFLFTSVNNTIAAQDKTTKAALELELLDALNWIKINTPKNSVILSQVEYGHLITGIAQRKNVLDDNFILIKNPDRILDDLEALFHTSSTIQAVKLLNKFHVNYLLLKIEDRPEFVKDKSCFKRVNKEEDYVTYESFCKVEEIG